MRINWRSELWNRFSFLGSSHQRRNRKHQQEKIFSALSPAIEVFEDRILLTVSLTGSPDWFEQGPGPMVNAQLDIPPIDPATGAVQSIAVHPNQPTHMVVGTAAGGVWRTTNANSATPGTISWTPVGDTLGSLSIGTVTYDTADSTGNTFFAGAGDFSNSFDNVGPATGLYRTTDGGTTWTLLGTGTPGGNPLAGLQIKSILAIGNTILVSGVNPFFGSRDYRLLGGALYRSTDGGNIFTQEVGVGVNDLPAGAVTSLVQDPNAANTVFAAIPGQGVYSSTDAGDNWTQVNTGLGLAGTESVIELAVEDNGATTTVYAAMATGNTLDGVFSTTNAGVNWNSLPGPLPASFSAGSAFAEKIQLFVDPDASGVVYIAGQGGGAQGAVYRYNPGGGGSWTSLFGAAANNTTPHVDSHDMRFLGNDTLLYASDGGLYLLNNPDSIGPTDTWQSFIGTAPNAIRAVEFFNVAYDPNGNRILGGSQDNGGEIQTGLNNPTWNHIQDGDGQNQEYDAVNNIRYGLGNNFGNFDRDPGGVGGTQMELRANGNPTNFSGLQMSDRPVAGGFTGFQPHVPFILNAVDPTRILIGRDGLYESDPTAILPTGDVIVDITPVGMGQARSVAYGGRRAGMDFVNVALVGTSTGQLYFRGETGAGFTNVTGGLGGLGAIEDIVLDPQDWRHVYVLRGDRIFVTDDITNLLNPFDEVTNNLSSFTNDVRSIELYDITPSTAGDSILLAGALGGVFRMVNDTWNEYGHGLPNILVQDVRFSTDDVDGNTANGIGRLIAGTMGRGAWTIDNVSATITSKAVLNIYGDTDFVNEDDEIRLVRRQENTDLLEVIVNGTSEGIFDIATIQQINVFGYGGDDTLIVDSTNGLITIQMGIRFNGGTGFDQLRFEQTGGEEQVADQLVLGATNGSGISFIGNGVDDDGDGVIDSAMEMDSQVVEFENLEPVIDLIPAATFAITAIPGLASLLDTDNAITYTASQIIASGGRVTVDAFEPIEFINKTSLVIDARAGRDNVVLNNAATPTGLTSVLVGGGDGADVIEVVALPDASAVGATFLSAFLTGGSGNDTIDASALAVVTPLTLSGEAGDDALIGGRGNDNFLGGPGNDLMIGGDPALTGGPIGNNIYSGGSEFDTIGILGTFLNDSIDVTQTSINMLTVNINGNTSMETFGGDNVEAARIVARAGDDTIRVTIDDSLVAPVGNPDDDVLRFEVMGDAPNASDRLIYQDDGIGDTIIQRKAPDDRSGTISLAPAHPNGAPPLLVYEGMERVDFIPLNPVTGGLGTDGEGRLIVFKHDPFEGNDTLPTATFLGSGATINIDPTIDPGAGLLGSPADEDWYEFLTAETGVLDFQVFFRQVPMLGNGRSGLPGDGDLNVTLYDSDGMPMSIGTGNDLIDAAGNIIGKRITVPAIRNQTYYMRVQGASGAAVNVYNFTVVNLPTPIPQLVDLVADTDSGRNDNDDVTFFDANTNGSAQFDIILDDDRIDEFMNLDMMPDTMDDDAFTAGFDYVVEVFNNGVSIGFAYFVSGNTWRFTTTMGDLMEGHNNFLSAAVRFRDPADPSVEGRGELSAALQVTLDTMEPPVSFGLSTDPDDGLIPGSDCGNPTSPETLTDNVTNVTNPTFWGRAEADTIVRVFLDLNEDGLVDSGDIFLGQDTAIPLDGDEAEPDGYWEIRAVVSLNDPDVIAALGLDGLRQILVTAEDLAGNVNAPSGGDDQVLQIFIDTQGPVVFDPDGIGPHHGVEIGGAIGYNLLAPILGQGSTPAVTSLIIHIEDLPARVAGFLYDALDQGVASQVGHYALVGDRQGIISIDDLIVTNLPVMVGQPARATIELRFDRPLADDRYTLTLFDELVDPACNHLDGESRASSPTGDLFVRSGDGVPGGDFVARFTVDSRVEIASVGQAVVQVDINGNYIFDPSTGDFVNRDQTYKFGLPTDAIFAGQLTPPGVPSDGYDRLGAYGNVNGIYRWLLDFNNDGIPDSSTNSIFQINGLPFAGEFVGNLGDEVGLFDGTTWYIDVTGDNNIGPGDVVFTGNMRGLPVTGDFDGDGLTDLATHVASTNTFFFDLTSVADGTPGVVDGNFDATIDFGFGGVLERPFAGDFNLDGVTDLGLTVPSQNQLTPNVSDWYVLLSNPAAHTPGTINSLINGFFPVPGEDPFTQFGSNHAVPVVGNFRAPAPQFANVLPGAGVVGADAGGGPHVRVFNNQTGEEKLSFMAYNEAFTGGVRVASGDVNMDGVADVITGPGPHGGPHLRVFDGTDGSELFSFMAYDEVFTGGIFVASGDVNADGFADIITGADAGGGPHVKVFSGMDGSELFDFMAYGMDFTGGVRVASGDVNMDGFADIITGAGPGGGPHVRVISGQTHSELFNYFAYGLDFRGGVYVASGDTNGDGYDDVITGAGPGAGPHVRVVSGQDQSDLLNFFAFSAQYTGGVRVGAGDANLDGQVDIFMTSGPGVSPTVRVVTGTGTELGNYSAFGAAFTGGAFVAGGPMPGQTLIVAGELEPGQPTPASLTDSQLHSIVAAAISRYEAAGLDNSRLGRLANVSFGIADLSGQLVGLSQGNTIFIDTNAAGRGWFVDPTPNRNEEFTANGQALDLEVGRRMDLLSVVLHELGHHLNLPERYAEGDAGRVMSATIQPGQRRLPTPDDLDNLFASESLFETLDL